VLEGSIEHADNHGNYGILEEGDVQFMTAGSGIIHRELPYKDGGHTLQLWLNLPPHMKMTPARYQDLPASVLPTITDDGVKIKIVSGEQKGKIAPTKNIWPILSLEGWIEPNHSYNIDIPSGYRAFLYIIQGRGLFGRHRKEVTSGNTIWLAPNQRNATFPIKSINRLHFFMCAGAPIGAPIFAQGPFVMNSQAEIRQAYRDYQMGLFGGPVQVTKRK
jgi:redox-sensitive bicupin YhaK (pirin superfamily)